MRNIPSRKFSGVLAATLGLSLAACAGGPGNTAELNRSLYSVNQPVIERSNMTFDVATNASGMPINEQQRLSGWFEAMDLRYGDRVAIDDPARNGATRAIIEELAGRFGVLVAEGAPLTEQFIQPGQARVVVTRSTASVPNCPNWNSNSDINYSNTNHSNYGCSVNSNMAAMIANPEDLIAGQKGSGETIVSTSTKAIQTYRDQEPTGAGGLAGDSTQGGN
jgi:pilus assembly protein CpaD